jgi:hypothetical protein
MSGRGSLEDLSTILFMLPFVGSGVYAIYLWASSGATAILPVSVYLNVTRDPYLFLGATMAVLAGLILDLRGVDPEKRRSRWPSAT